MNPKPKVGIVGLGAMGPRGRRVTAQGVRSTVGFRAARTELLASPEM